MKPRIICHVMTSVDGQIGAVPFRKTYRNPIADDALETYDDIDRSLFTDAWTLGKSIVTEIFPDKFSIFTTRQPDEEKDKPVGRCCSYMRERRSERLFISIDPQSEIVYTSTHLKGDNIVAVLNASTATPRYLTYLRGMDISYLVVEQTSDLRSVLEKLNREFHIKSISLQGGGMLNGAMLNQGMIDELSIVLYPGISTTNDAVPLFVQNGNAMMPQKNLELLSVQQKNFGTIWMRYKVHN